MNSFSGEYDWLGTLRIRTHNGDPIVRLCLGDTLQLHDEDHEVMIQIAYKPMKEQDNQLLRIMDWMSIMGYGRDKEKASKLMRMINGIDDFDWEG